MRGGVLAGAAAGPSCWGVVSWGVAIEGRLGRLAAAGLVSS